MVAFLRACLFLLSFPNYVSWLSKYYVAVLSLSCFYLQPIVAIVLLKKQPILKDCLPQRDLSSNNCTLFFKPKICNAEIKSYVYTKLEMLEGYIFSCEVFLSRVVNICV